MIMWLVVILLVALLGIIATVQFGYGRFLAVFVAALGLGVAGLIAYALRDEATTRSGVPISAVVLQNFSMQPTYANGYALSGRVQNTAREHVLRKVVVRVTASDCGREGQKESCDIIGERTRDLLVSIPPGQSRDVRAVLNFEPMQPQGELRWAYSIESTEAN